MTNNRQLSIPYLFKISIFKFRSCHKELRVSFFGFQNGKIYLSRSLPYLCHSTLLHLNISHHVIVVFPQLRLGHNRSLANAFYLLLNESLNCSRHGFSIKRDAENISYFIFQFLKSNGNSWPLFYYLTIFLSPSFPFLLPSNTFLFKYVINFFFFEGFLL